MAREGFRVVRRRVETGAVIFAAVAFSYWLNQALREPYNSFRIDVRVYQAGAQAVLAGRPLYEPVFVELFFVYPPFAALAFLPMALVDLGVLGSLWIVVNAVLTVWTVGMVTRESRGAGSIVTRGATAFFGFGFLLLLVPLADTFWLGQINVVIMALVVRDLVALRGPPRERRWAGVGIGLAAGLKLTPLLFVVLLLVSRQWRAAAVASGTFAATVLLGFLVLPRDAWQFWTVAVRDTRRIAPSTWIVNQSLDGVLARLAPGAPGWVWLAGAAAVCLAALWVGGRLVNRGLPVLGAGVVGAASCVAAPFSWEHHWIWLVILVWWPLVAALVGAIAGDRRWPWWLGWGVATLLLTARYDRDGHAIGTFAFGGADGASWWTASYPLGAGAVIATLCVAELAGRGARRPHGPLPPVPEGVGAGVGDRAGVADGPGPSPGGPP